MAAIFTRFAFVLWVIFVDFYSNIANAELVVKPKDTVVLVSQPTYFNCSTSVRNISASFVVWYHYPSGSPSRNDVYDEGQIMHEYKDRFSIETNVADGVFNLVVERPTVADAGRYECQDGVGQGDKAPAELIILDGNPSCESNMNPDGVIGPNDCGIEPDEMQLTCNVSSSHGNIPPSLGWKISGDGSSSSLVVCERSTSCQLTLKADLTFNSKSFVCQTTNARRQQYGCSVGPIKVKYALSSGVKLATEGDVKCYTNSSQRCNYTWYNSKNETVSKDEKLVKQKPGQYKCRAQCEMNQQNDQLCGFIAMEVQVVSPAAVSDAQLVLMSISIVICIVVVLIIIIIIIVCLRKQHRCPNIFNNKSDKVVVQVLAKTDENLRKIHLDSIVYQMREILQGKTSDKSTALQEAVSTLIKYELIDVSRVKKDIVFFFHCSNMEKLFTFRDLLMIEVERNITLIYSEVLSTNVHIKVALDDAAFKKAEKKLQAQTTSTGQNEEEKSSLLNKDVPDGTEMKTLLPDSQMEPSAKHSSLPIISDQDMVDSLTINEHFMDRGTSGAIYGPFKWKDKKCVLKQILYSPDKVTEEKREEISQLRDRCKQLNHHNLVKVFEVWFPSPALYIVMEYAEARSLDKLLRPKDAPSPLLPFTNEIVKDWALQIADGMRYLHEQKLVHRNLKAAHVLVMESPETSPKTLKIGSYTLAKEHDHSTVLSLKGTMAWMAPEYIRGEKFSTLSDVWSYGVTVWEILTRDVPYKDFRKETDLVRAAMKETLKLEIPESCPEQLRTMLTECWNYAVDKRPSFEEICDNLRLTLESWQQ